MSKHKAKSLFCISKIVRLTPGSEHKRFQKKRGEELIRVIMSDNETEERGKKQQRKTVGILDFSKQ
ncbi:MAG: hypothetical protein ACRD8Z_24260 [Nitrososphaeraceae archaeon]